MDEEIDIYADLSITEKKVPEIVTKEKELTTKCSELAKQVESLKVQNEILNKNLSSLLKTAKAEITRKDNKIKELRQELDNIAFRRNRQYNKYPEKSNEFYNMYYSSVQPSDQLSSETTDYSSHAYIQNDDEIAHYPSLPESYENNLSPSPLIKEENDNNEQDTEQKYNPDKVCNTLYGERLKRKLKLIEEEERLAIKDSQCLLAVQEEEKLNLDEEVKSKVDNEQIINEILIEDNKETSNNEIYEKLKSSEELIESQNQPSVSAEEYAARLMPIALKTENDHSVQSKLDQESNYFRNDSHSCRNLPEDPRRNRRVRSEDRKWKEDSQKHPRTRSNERHIPQHYSQPNSDNYKHRKYNSNNDRSSPVNSRRLSPERSRNRRYSPDRWIESDFIKDSYYFGRDSNYNDNKKYSNTNQYHENKNLYKKYDKGYHSYRSTDRWDKNKDLFKEKDKYKDRHRDRNFKSRSKSPKYKNDRFNSRYSPDKEFKDKDKQYVHKKKRKFISYDGGNLHTFKKHKTHNDIDNKVYPKGNDGILSENECDHSFEEGEIMSLSENDFDSNLNKNKISKKDYKHTKNNLPNVPKVKSDTEKGFEKIEKKLNELDKIYGNVNKYGIIEDCKEKLTESELKSVLESSMENKSDKLFTLNVEESQNEKTYDLQEKYKKSEINHIKDKDEVKRKRNIIKTDKVESSSSKKLKANNVKNEVILNNKKKLSETKLHKNQYESTNLNVDKISKKTEKKESVKEHKDIKFNINNVNDKEIKDLKSKKRKNEDIISSSYTKKILINNENNKIDTQNNSEKKNSLLNKKGTENDNVKIEVKERDIKKIKVEEQKIVKKKEKCLKSDQLERTETVAEKVKDIISNDILNTNQVLDNDVNMKDEKDIQTKSNVKQKESKCDYPLEMIKTNNEEINQVKLNIKIDDTKISECYEQTIENDNKDLRNLETISQQTNNIIHASSLTAIKELMNDEDKISSTHGENKANENKIETQNNSSDKENLNKLEPKENTLDGMDQSKEVTDITDICHSHIKSESENEKMRNEKSNERTIIMNNASGTKQESITFIYDDTNIIPELPSVKVLDNFVSESSEVFSIQNQINDDSSQHSIDQNKKKIEETDEEIINQENRPINNPDAIVSEVIEDTDVDSQNIPNDFSRRRKNKLVVSVGKINPKKECKLKKEKVRTLLDRNFEGKLKTIGEDQTEPLNEEHLKSRKKEGTVKKIVKNEKKAPIVFRRRRPMQLSSSSTCVTVVSNDEDMHQNLPNFSE